jgi:hypothetical protein
MPANGLVGVMLEELKLIYGLVAELAESQLWVSQHKSVLNSRNVSSLDVRINLRSPVLSGNHQTLLVMANSGLAGRLRYLAATR